MTRPPLDPGLFGIDSDHLWVQHCSDGPVPLASIQAVQECLGKEAAPWKMDFFRDALGLPAEVRREAARIIGASSETDISLTATTSTGLVTVAQGLQLAPGDEILAPLGEFPSNAWPWKALEAKGVTFREAPLWEGHRAGSGAWDSLPPQVSDDPEARILEALGPRTRVLALSWVRFQDGLKLDLRRIGESCRQRGVSFVVDGIQGAGCALPDLTFADAFATGGHKGLLSPQGLGFLWTTPEFRAGLVPSGSWLSVEDGTDFRRASTDLERDWLADGRRLEAGSPNLLGCAALRSSLATLNGAGVPAIEAHIKTLQARLLEGLQGGPWARETERLSALLQAGRLGPILALHHQGLGVSRLLQILGQAADQGVYASVREGYLRIAFHGWHTKADAERIARLLTLF